MFGLKETTVVVIFGMAALVVLAIFRPDLITSDTVTWVMSIGLGGKAVQGAADRFKPSQPHANPSTRVEAEK